MSDNRVQLRQTFDTVADQYDAARPSYPPELFDDIEELAAITPGDELLEVGSGTGQATRELARRGYPVTCIELGAAMALEASRQLRAFPHVQVITADFEHWRPPAGTSYRLLLAATSWHWLDPTVRYQRAWELLAPGGHLALWSSVHVLPEGGDPFFEEIQDVYDEIGERLPPGYETPRPGRLPDDASDVLASGLFEDVEVRQFDWEMQYDADAYLALLSTFSGHIAMQPWQRERLYGEVRRRLAEREDGSLRRHWGAVLHVARRVAD